MEKERGTKRKIKIQRQRGTEKGTTKQSARARKRWGGGGGGGADTQADGHTDRHPDTQDRQSSGQADRQKDVEFVNWGKHVKRGWWSSIDLVEGSSLIAGGLKRLMAGGGVKDPDCPHTLSSTLSSSVLCPLPPFSLALWPPGGRLLVLPVHSPVLVSHKVQTIVKKKKEGKKERKEAEEGEENERGGEKSMAFSTFWSARGLIYSLAD